MLEPGLIRDLRMRWDRFGFLIWSKYYVPTLV